MTKRKFFGKYYHAIIGHAKDYKWTLFQHRE